MGIRVKVLRSEKTDVDLFTGAVTHGPKKGMLRSFPICGRCAAQRDCKIRPIRRYQKSLPMDTVQYIGIARDEQERRFRQTGQQVSLLEKCHFTEKNAMRLCRKAGLLSLVYAFADRGSCWFCPDAKARELRHLQRHEGYLYPDGKGPKCHPRFQPGDAAAKRRGACQREEDEGMGESKMSGGSQGRQRPSCPLAGQNRNIFNLIGLVGRVLRKNGMTAETQEMQDRIMGGDCRSYGEALRIISKYVETELPPVAAKETRKKEKRTHEQ